MVKGLISCVVLTAVVTTLVLGQNQQGMTKCQQDFLQNLNTCFKDNMLEFNNFLWLVSNGTNGQSPESADTLKQYVCAAKEELMTCGVDFMKIMINSTECASTDTMQDQRPMIDRQFRTLFGSLDEMCAHPCRRTLPNDLRQCYVNAELDPDLFLSNATMARGAVLGTTVKQAEDFCIHKDALISCMKQRRDDCPESPIILRAIGLDIDSMEKGVKVLCAHKDIYLTSIDCFSESTEAVIACQRNMAGKTADLMSRSQQEKVSEDEFFNQFCEIRLEHVACDLESWSKKVHKACTEGVLGLRTELECGLLPDACVDSHKDVTDDVCDPDRFKSHLRSGAGVVGTSALVVTVFAFLSLY